MPLINSMKEHRCLILIGAGVSEASGVISTEALVKELKNELLNSDVVKSSNELKDEILKSVQDLQSAQTYYRKFFKNGRGKKRISEIISDSQKGNEVNASPYGSLMLFPMNDFLTTNFDTLLETKAKDKVGSQFVHVLTKDSHIKDYNPDKINIIKLHGTMEDYTSLIISKSEIEEVRESEIFKKILSDLHYKSLLVIGSSMQDHDLIRAILGAQKINNEKLYAIARNKGAISELEELKFNIIDGNLIDILEEMGDFFSDIPYSEGLRATKSINIKQTSREDNNPFKFWTTDGLTREQFKDLNEMFVAPNYAGFSKIYSHDKHHIIQGARGTGKTVILRGLSIEYLGNIEKQDHFGFWIPMNPELTGPIKKDKETEPTDWYNSFASYLSVLFAEKAIDSLNYCHQNGTFKPTAGAIEDFIRKVSGDFSFDPNEIHTLGDLYEAIGDFRSKSFLTYGETRENTRFTDPSYYRRFFESRLPHLSPIFKDKPIFIVLDDAHNLNESQKKVLVTMIANRVTPISFKIGTAMEFGVYQDYFNTTIQDSKDYETIYLDRIDPRTNGQKQYEEFLEELSNIRLHNAGQHIKVKDLLPPFATKPLKGEHYAGFNDYVALSSHVIREYISLVKDTIYAAYPNVYKQQAELEPINPKIQNEQINIKSVVFFNEIQNAGELQTSVKNLIDTMGELFRKIYAYSKETRSKELRTTTGIEIKNYDKLSHDSRIVIEKAVELQLLQVPMQHRLTPNSGSPFEGLKFHRMLCPYFKLKLGYRYPRNVKAEDLNEIISGKGNTKKKFVDKMTAALRRETMKKGNTKIDESGMDIDENAKIDPDFYYDLGEEQNE